MSPPRRFSQAISEGDGISLIAEVEDAEVAARVEERGADAILVSPALADAVGAIRAATALPIVARWVGNAPADFGGVDACVLVGDAEREWLERVYGEVRDALEIAFWIEDEEQLETALEDFDPEIFILAAPDLAGEEALEHVLDLLPDVPAGKLAIAELAGSDADEVAALERAGFDAVVVEPGQLPELAGDAPPDV